MPPVTIKAAQKLARAFFDPQGYPGRHRFGARCARLRAGVISTGGKAATMMRTVAYLLPFAASLAGY